MITSIRSIVLCDSVESPATGAANYIGLHGSQLLAGHRPGGFMVWIAIMADVDRRQTVGHILVETPHVKLTVPFNSTTDRDLTSMAFPIVLAIDEPCHLVVTIIDDGRRDKPFKFRWSLDFRPDAKPAPIEEWVKQAELARASNDETLKSLRGQPFTRH